MSDAGVTGGDIFVVPINGPINGGVARNITPNLKASPFSLAWTSPDRIVFAENVDGNSGFGSVSAIGGEAQTVWTGEEVAAADEWGSGGSFSSDGTVPPLLHRQRADL